MKSSSISYTLALAGVTAIGLAFSPVQADNNTGSTADGTQNTKVIDSTADNSASTGNPSSKPDNSNSKDTANALDKNPSTAPTDSADAATTKNPNVTGSDQNVNSAPGNMAGNENRRTGRTSDRQFIVKAAEGGMTEVELGKLAQEKASSPDVKQFGARMVTDHSKADADLKALADKKGVPVPESLDSKHKAMVEHFQRLSGSAFDRAYVKAMVRDHENDATEYREASTSAQDPDVKSYAGDTLKVIESHLSDIKSIQSNLK
jgi:putative membrane protein